MQNSVAKVIACGVNKLAQATVKAKEAIARQEDLKLFDVNGDGKLNKQELELKKTYVDKKKEIEFQMKFDRNEDGEIDETEAAAMSLYLATKAVKSSVPQSIPQGGVNAVAPKPEAPKPEASKPEAPKPAEPEAPKAEVPKTEAPKAEAPKAEAPKAEAPKAEAPKAEEPNATQKRKPIVLSDKAQNIIKNILDSETKVG